MSSPAAVAQQQTLKNLESAFAGESMANRKYLYFARLARLKGDEVVAKLFEATADEETAHALAHLSQLYPADRLEVADLLRIAMEGELYETREMYPAFAEVAKVERAHAAVSEFEAQAAESAGHAEIFRQALTETELLKSEKRFVGLAKVEARHAKRYEDALAALSDTVKDHAAE